EAETEHIEDEAEDKQEQKETTEPDEVEQEEAVKGSGTIQTFNVKQSGVSESKTSLLAHIRSENTTIYKEINGSSFKAGSTYTHAVYYVKKQAVHDGETYYLISTRPSATVGTVGWVKARDLSTHDHVGVDREAKTFYIKGNGKATSKAWGGQ